MNTIRIYETDSHARRLQARVLSCEESENGWLVELDRTIFYPTGGGQPCDTGTLGGADVTETLLRGETVLVLGAAGGLGIASIELAKAMGARVIAAASSAEKLAVCRAHGADETIDYEREDLRERLKAITGGRGVDVVCDVVGGRFSELSLRSTAWRGRFLVIGFAGGEIPRISLNLPLLKGCSIVGVFWGDYLKRERASVESDIKALAELYTEGRIRPLISQRFSLEETPAALEAIRQRKAIGKGVVVP